MPEAQIGSTFEQKGLLEWFWAEKCRTFVLFGRVLALCGHIRRPLPSAELSNTNLDRC